jgi:hypothetical protein
MDSGPESIKKTLDKVKTLYGKLGYFDQYGGAIIIFIIITIIVFIIISYCISKSNAQELIDDWPNQRCKLAVMPYAGYITHPEGTTAFDYTQENFNYCVQNILASISGPAVQPLSFITTGLTSMANQIQESLQAIRAVFDRLRSAIEDVVKNIMSRLINIFTPMQKIILGAKDILNKMQGTMVTILFSALGGYFSLKSLLGAVAQFFIFMLITLAIIIFILLVVPFTSFMAGPLIAIFVTIAAMVSALLICMKLFLGIEGYVVPSMKCFDKNTEIPMNDGSEKIISEMKVGDILLNNNEVTGVIRVATAGSDMYYLDDIFVSDSHIVKHCGKWIPVAKHPDSMKCAEYNDPYLYCLNTSKKTIVINDTTFTDWDEVYDKDIEDIYNNPFVKLDSVETIHSQLDGGFVGSTLVNLIGGKSKQIKDILIDDVLENGEKVYGVVEIDGLNLSEQFQFILGENVVEGGPNLVFNKAGEKVSTLGIQNKIPLERKHDKLYHLLTDKKTFTIGNIQFCDYNAAIDIFLEKKQ